jgi:DNA-binding MarR family transcriptional regulator
MTAIESHARAVVQVDKLLHEPARLGIMAILYVTEAADFLYIRKHTTLTKGNLSAHLSKLEDAGYIVIEKRFEGKTPRTLCQLTEAGRARFDDYLATMRGVFDVLT